MSAGVDPQVSLFYRLDSTATSQQHPWAYLSSKRPHSHDVRAMCVAAGRALPDGARLLTGSNDTQLFSHSVAAFQKVSGLPHRVGGAV